MCLFVETAKSGIGWNTFIIYADRIDGAQCQLTTGFDAKEVGSVESEQTLLSTKFYGINGKSVVKIENQKTGGIFCDPERGPHPTTDGSYIGIYGPFTTVVPDIKVGTGNRALRLEKSFLRFLFAVPDGFQRGIYLRKTDG
jgi:hypothetical protein